MNSLKNYLATHFRFSEEENEKMSSFFDIQSLGKNEFFLKEGQYCKSIGFVESGSFLYYFLRDGEEKVCDFAFESDWMTNYKSLLNNVPAELSIKALEASKIFTITFEKMHAMIQEVPAANLVRTKLAEQHFLQSTEHASNLANLKAEERYQKLLDSKPFIHQKVPQYYIASYLGIKPQSLSRIRANK